MITGPAPRKGQVERQSSAASRCGPCPDPIWRPMILARDERLLGGAIHAIAIIAPAVATCANRHADLHGAHIAAGVTGLRRECGTLLWRQRRLWCWRGRRLRNVARIGRIIPGRRGRVIGRGRRIVDGRWVIIRPRYEDRRDADANTNPPPTVATITPMCQGVPWQGADRCRGEYDSGKTLDGWSHNPCPWTRDRHLIRNLAARLTFQAPAGRRGGAFRPCARTARRLCGCRADLI